MSRSQLEALARIYGVEPGYHDISGRHRPASDEAMLALLRALGAPLAGPDDVDDALRSETWARASRLLDPVQVVWTDAVPQVGLRILESARVGAAEVEIRGPDAHHRAIRVRLEDLEVLHTREVEGRRYVQLAVPLPEMPPVGYATIEARLGPRRHSGRLLVAPRRVKRVEEPSFGLFAPTYALRAHHDRGLGDLAHLERLARWSGAHGARFVGTLPLLAAFLDTPFEPSPYLPVSKRFWNEAYLDLAHLPEVDDALKAELPRLEGAFEEDGKVDFRGGYARLRPFLDACSARAWSGPARAELEAFAEANPLARRYAQFRAATELAGKGWPVWDHAQLPEDPAREQLHLYVQHRMSQQLRTLAASLRRDDVQLYLDLPLGVHPDGFDAWADRDCFIEGFSAGAPPDALAPEGQDWGFRPLHPDHLRARGHAYFAASVRQQAEIAGVLRLDHVMGLHRVYCVPIGGSARDGTYVRFAAEELWAVVCIESALNDCCVVGEDLGTVPEAVRTAMSEHGAVRMYVSQFEVEPDRDPVLTPVPDDVVASVNTHDTPTFAGFWRHRDIVERVERGVLTEEEGQRDHAQRDRIRQAVIRGLRAEGRLSDEDAPSDVLVGLLMRLAESPAPLAIVTLEDLWLEEAPQNVPGTSWQRPNWRRRMQVALELIEEQPEIRGLLQALAAARAP
jgi:4-alpha-glucanotransferase